MLDLFAHFYPSFNFLKGLTWYLHLNTNNMKQIFDNDGVAKVQASVVGLPAAELAAEVTYIRTDFKGWMRKCFDLHPNQEQQLDIMPEDFALRLANAIADHYEQRVPVQFYKETRAEDDKKDFKDLI